MKRLIIGAALLAVIAGPAIAQQKHNPPAVQNPAYQELQEKKKDAAVIDRQYRSALERTKKETTAAAPTDPWSNMRGDDPKTDAAKPKR